LLFFLGGRQAGNGVATRDEDFVTTIRAELAAAVEKSGLRILRQRCDQIGGSGICLKAVDLEIAMFVTTSHRLADRYCAAHGTTDGSAER
jgi:hypothetical protein